MKLINHLLLYSLVFLHTIAQALSHDIYDPILVAVIMVKNEETVMQKTLQPFVDGGVDTFFIFDTGSTDNTIAVTQEFFDTNNIQHGYIQQEPFINFAASRNRALELAQQQFPNAAFMVMFDAEWYLNDAHALVDFCNLCLTRNDMYASYLIRILNSALDFYTPRLIKCNCNVRFEGVVHEIICSQNIVKVPENIYFEYLPETKGIEKSAQRYFRDRKLLYKEYYKNPRDTRNLFYLARTCEDIGNLEEAYDLYKQRIALIGWDEEDFMSVYRLAQTVEKLSYQNENYRWHEALGYYLQAYKMRPNRAEPLISIAYYYVHQDDMHTAFLFARRAIEIPYPYKDVLFVQKHAYDYLRYELLARCAWYIDEFEIGEQAAKNALQVHPEYKHAQHNVRCYEDRKINRR